MLIPNRIRTDTKPSIIEDLNSGYWYYNYDIQKTQEYVPKEIIDDVEEISNVELKTMYNYIQIKMLGKPDYKRCVELIIREYITQSQEFDLINSANKALIQGITDSQDILKYKEYLHLVEIITSKVAKDLGK